MQFIIVGIGGQGILFTSKVLGHIALTKGQKVVGSEVHGMSQRGGSVISHYKIGDYYSPLVEKGQADILLAFDQMEALRNYDFLKTGGSAVVNIHDPEHFEDESLRQFFSEKQINLYRMMGYDILKKHMKGNFLFLNVLILGAMCGAGLGGVSLTEVKDAVSELAPSRFVEANLKVLDLGYEALRG
ncbi:MAG TPA: 2-oxoacid:acceptor oxidoreductase family protein [Synergistales bacterium]|nr:2-oxoacid:acceptor oxidoreductase family protein [Synergistales bacterium]